MQFDLGSLIGGALQAGAIAGGLIFAGRQVKLAAQQNEASERWQKTKFAAALLERMTSDEELLFCTRALDWGVGPLVIPGRYRSIFPAHALENPPLTNSSDPRSTRERPEDAAPFREETFEHRWGDLARAVRPGLTHDWNKPRILTYRYCFDTLGSYLEIIQRHIDVGNIDPKYLVGLRYYLNLLANPGYYSILPNEEKLPGVDALHVFRDFMMLYYPDAWYLVETRDSLPLPRSFTPIDE